MGDGGCCLPNCINAKIHTKMRGDRRFSDFDEKSIVPLFENAGFEIVYNEVGTDNRPGREDEMWVNAIGKKKLI